MGVDKLSPLCYNKCNNRKGVSTMKIFRTEMMDWANYNKYMSGSYSYAVDYYDVEAETKAEAIAIAKKDNPSYHINTYVIEVEKKVFTATEKDRLIARIAELEETLQAHKKGLEKLEKGVDK